MSRITDLIERMSVIPEREKKATQLDDMIVIRNKLETAAVTAGRLRASISATRRIDGTAFTDKPREGLEAASATAHGLKSALTSGAGFNRSQADKALTSINEKLSQASNGVTKGWRILVEGRVRRFSPLADVAKRAALPGAAPLAAAITTLETWTASPPTDEQAAQAFSETANSLPSAVAKLGLEGRAGQFMVDAANGTAKAKDLQDREVLEFLEDNPTIWSMLKVGL